jgi:hypothetical protein
MRGRGGSTKHKRFTLLLSSTSSFMFQRSVSFASPSLLPVKHSLDLKTKTIVTGRKEGEAQEVVANQTKNEQLIKPYM